MPSLYVETSMIVSYLRSRPSAQVVAVDVLDGCGLPRPIICTPEELVNDDIDSL
jgi:hypothetical protein